MAVPFDGVRNRTIGLGDDWHGARITRPAPVGPASRGSEDAGDEAGYPLTYQSATFHVGPTDDGLPVKFWTFGFTSQTSSR